jgi:hypothetical protein
LNLTEQEKRGMVESIEYGISARRAAKDEEAEKRKRRERVVEEQRK